MNFKQLRYFCEVIDAGTLARAAERLFVAPTAISMQIAQLEEDLGGELFDRKVRPMVLTTLGQFFLPRARELLAQKLHVEQLTRDVATGKAGALTIGFVRSLMFSILPRAVRIFRTKHPNVKLELIEMLSEDQPANLRASRIHIGLSRHVRVEQTQTDIKHQLLFEDAYVAAVPAHSPLAKKKTASLKTLSELPLILFPVNPTSTYAANVLAMYRASGIEPCLGSEAIEIHTALGLVAAGMGYTIVGASVSERVSSDVVFLALPEFKSKSRIVAVSRADESSALVESMLSILTDLEQPMA